MSSHSTPSTHPAPPSPQLQPHLCSGQASDQGNTIYAIPYALRPIHGPPYPELTIVLIPNILREARTAPRPTTAPRRTTALRRTAPHRAAPRRTAPHRTAPPRRVECPYELLYRPGGRDPPLQLRPVLGRGRRNDGEFAPTPPPWLLPPTIPLHSGPPLAGCVKGMVLPLLCTTSHLHPSRAHQGRQTAEVSRLFVREAGAHPVHRAGKGV